MGVVLLLVLWSGGYGRGCYESLGQGCGGWGVVAVGAVLVSVRGCTGDVVGVVALSVVMGVLLVVL